MDRRREKNKVTVIIPVYNKEKYIVRCLDSLKDQSLKEIEILCVDDASEDLSNSRIKECMESDGRIRLLENTRNQGVAYSRNLGIMNSEGEYLFFLDADDYLDHTALEHYYDELCAADADMCFYNFMIQNESKHRADCDEGIRNSYREIYEGKDLLGYFARNDEFFLYACMVAYKREFIEKHKIRFSDLKCGEGGLFILEALIAAVRVIVSEFKGYHYCLNDDSVNAGEDIVEEALYGQVTQYIYALTQAAQKKEAHGICEFLDWYKGKFSGAIANLTDSTIRKFNEKFEDDFSRYIWSLLVHGEESRELFRSEDLMVLKEEKAVVLYGAGRETLDVLKLLNRYQVEVMGILVTEKKGNPDVMYGYRIEDLNALEKYSEDTLIVITAHLKHHGTIAAALEARGFRRHIDIRRR